MTAIHRHSWTDGEISMVIWISDP
jgi:hypothetical protein